MTADAAGEQAFDQDVVRLFADEMEVDIETWSAERAARRTTIWIVVVDGVPLIRSVRGERGRWYRDLIVEPHGAVHAAGRRIPVRAIPVEDQETISACSDAFREKYRGDPAVRTMVRTDVLGTTLRLVPA